MVPKYPFHVVVDETVSHSKINRVVKSFETLTAAVEYRNAVSRRRLTRRVQVTCILDDWRANEELMVGGSAGDMVPR